MDVKKVKEQLVGAGIEVYRTRPNEIHVAERVRLHIMDSGIRVHLSPTSSGAAPSGVAPSGVAPTEGGAGARISFTARSQRSDYPPTSSDDELFARVRSVVGRGAEERGYVETWSGTTPVKDPIDDQKVLDVWHEVTYAKAVDGADGIVDEIRWALGLERYVAPG